MSDLLIAAFMWNSHELRDNFSSKEESADIFKPEYSIIAIAIGEFEGCKGHCHEAGVRSDDKHYTVEDDDGSPSWIYEEIVFECLLLLVDLIGVVFLIQILGDFVFTD